MNILFRSVLRALIGIFLNYLPYTSSVSSSPRMSQTRLGLSGPSPLRAKLVLMAGLGIGAASLYFAYKRLTRKGELLNQNKREEKCNEPRIEVARSADDRNDCRRAPEQYANGNINGIVPYPSALSDSLAVDRANPLEIVRLGYLCIRDLKLALLKACAGLNLVKNRSEKDRYRADLLQSVVDRIKFLETDLSQLAADGSVEKMSIDEHIGSGSAYSTAYSSHRVRATTLSVLSDDSFMSAVSDFGVSLDDDEFEENNVAPEEMFMYKEALEAAQEGKVAYRKDRHEVCQCESEMDFAAKVHCLRAALSLICSDAKKRVWLANSGRQLLADLLKHSKQDPTNFLRVFDEMIEFCAKEENLEIAAGELKSRGVSELGFWDIILDFILLDAFDDLKQPPSAIYSVTKNTWLPDSMKISTISTVIWSMLKAKRQRLQVQNGFVSHFYNISETLMPAITLGFLGTDVQMGELCHYFKEQITHFVIDIFNTQKVRYTDVDRLADDVWVILETRTEAIVTRLSSEVPPA